MRRRLKAVPGPYVRRLRLERDKVPSFDKYPFNLPVAKELEELELHPKVTFFVGENGAGKSTLLEAVAVGCHLNPEGGSRNFRFSTRASHSPLCDYLRVGKTTVLPKDSFFLRAESFFNVASEIERLDEGDGGAPIISAYGGRSLHEQSHGESFFALFEHRFHGCGLYILDEPEAALSPKRQLSFLSLMHRLCGTGSQWIIATHSPLIMAYPESWIYVFDERGITRTPYAETDHFQTASAFFSNPDLMLRSLLRHRGRHDATGGE